MCGITGFIRSQSASREEQFEIVTRMAQAIAHRGPDRQGVWVHPRLPLALGHRRLSILELSAAGDQPFVENEIALVFNGEIYNHHEIREQLIQRGHKFRGRSDTEVMFRAFGEWGCQKALEKMVGMFAFAYVNETSIQLGRDRMGEKPLYYGWGAGAFVFGSELKALLQYPGFQPGIAAGSLGNFLRFSCIPAPDSIYENVFKLPPATLLTLPLSGEQSRVELKSYWSLDEVARGPQSERSEEENLEQISFLLERAIAEQAEADVPLGAFLSGGIDSSLIVALMQKQASRPIKTFTIGFAEDDFNEAKYASEVARHLGTDHTELYVGAEEAMRVIPRLPAIYDEPFADSSQIPTFLVAQLARRQVAVSLSGDGGDEVFAGYNRHFLGSSLWGKLEKIPAPLRQKMAGLIEACPLGARQSLLKVISSLAASHPRQLNEKVDKLITCLKAGDPQEMYLQLLTQEKNPESLLLGSVEQASQSFRRPGNPLFTMQFFDSQFYLPNDILTKVDRATMAVSLESRAPFLDHRLVEFAWSLPANQRVRGGKGKWPLRQLLARHLPTAMFDRPKSGFAIPINSWLKGPLREWAESLLSPTRIQREGIFRPAALEKLWRGYLSGQENSQYRIWNVLMFQAWQESRLLVTARSVALTGPEREIASGAR